jgi:hypothetical protein
MRLDLWNLLRLALPVGWLIALPAPAGGPSGADLLQACRTALNNGFKGYAAAMCTWYVPPCDCQAKNSVPATLAWCGPGQNTTQALAPALVKQFEMHPALAELSATEAAEQALALAYPCPAYQSPD